MCKNTEKRVMKKTTELLQHFPATFQKQSDSMFFTIINLSFNTILSEAERNLNKNTAKKTSKVERAEDNFQTGLLEKEQPY